MESSVPDPTMRLYITEMNKLHYKLHNRLTDEEDRDILVLLDHVRCGIIKRSIQLRN